MMVALAIPPSSHIVCNPYQPPRCSNALINVVMMRAPLAPNGCPIAMAPPLTFVLARSTPVSCAQALATGICGESSARRRVLVRFLSQVLGLQSGIDVCVGPAQRVPHVTRVHST